eukprot:TRINITY_DN124710_c0_g1_i1.p1 TRINITY_DN124710_c0_g1~~TRINITY_DN124710_c0_g1_i1.p1  ORF type:complete len:236 (-),score=61.65 TRINITY_DN124710_c0_g1_i1:53-760(-)
MVFLSFNASVTPAEEIADEDYDDHDSGDPAEEPPLPLRAKWIVWQQLMAMPGKAVAYGDSTRQIACVDTVESFWQTWSRLPQPSQLLQRRMAVKESADTGGYHYVDAMMLFREGIQPQWEDPANAEGGHFQFHFKATAAPGQVDEHWNNLVLGVIGSTIEPADMITGVRLVDKLQGRRDGNLRIEVWFSNMRDNKNVSFLQRNVERCVATRTLEGRIAGAPMKAEVKTHTLNWHQ